MLYKKMLVTLDDIRRINDDLIHKRVERHLSDSDEMFFTYVKSIIGDTYNRRFDVNIPKDVKKNNKFFCDVRA